MPINPNLLITSPTFQEAIIDKNGEAMAGGTVTCYQDNSRTTLKNWYYQSGTPGNYTYVRLPNPLTLSAAGSVCDINGVDTMPFFYPYSELDQTEKQPYYITIVNHDMTNQITRANFPFNPTNTTPETEGVLDNYIINNVFWRNVGSVNLVNSTNVTVCPSQHDGFQYPDIQFFKNVTGGQDTLTFTKFPLTNTPVLTGDITPEFYINHTCSNAQTGELQKYYQFPLSLHVNTLNAVQCTFTIQAQNAGGTAPGQNVITVYIFQDTGTGTSAPAPVRIGTITLNPSWTKYDIPFTTPATGGLVLSGAGDDALYIQIQMPTDIECNINFTKPSLYIGTEVPTNSFETYDQIDTVINSPRTGDLRTSVNSFYPFGWVPMNNGTIGNASSNATARKNIDTWPVFNLLWTLFESYSAPGAGTSNPICQMYNSAGSPVGYGNNLSSPTTAISDWNANNQLALTSMMGKVLVGTVPISTMLAPYIQNPVSIGTSGGNVLFTVTTITGIFTGQPLVMISSNSIFPGSLTAFAVYYVTNIAGNTFQVATSFANALAGTATGGPATASGTLTFFFQIQGTTEGEYSHTQSIAELAAHSHTYTVISNLAEAAGPGTDIPITLSTANTGTTGSSRPFNVTQPGTFYNIYIKL